MRAMFSSACSPGAPSISFILARPRSYFLSSGMRAPFSGRQSAVIFLAREAPLTVDFALGAVTSLSAFDGALRRAEAKCGDEIGAGGVGVGVLIFLAHVDAFAP